MSYSATKPLALSAVFLLCTLPALSQNGSAPDNSKQNQSQSPTADNQSNAKSDIQITAGIRRALMHDKSLSTYAHNVKIVTKGGQVTLEGPVKTEQEKQQVATDAASVISAGQITNQLTVKQ